MIFYFIIILIFVCLFQIFDSGAELYKAIQGLTLGRQQEESGICDSGVETSF